MSCRRPRCLLDCCHQSWSNQCRSCTECQVAGVISQYCEPSRPPPNVSHSAHLPSHTACSTPQTRRRLPALPADTTHGSTACSSSTSTCTCTVCTLVQFTACVKSTSDILHTATPLEAQTASDVPSLINQLINCTRCSSTTQAHAKNTRVVCMNLPGQRYCLLWQCRHVDYERCSQRRLRTISVQCEPACWTLPTHLVRVQRHHTETIRRIWTSQ